MDIKKSSLSQVDGVFAIDNPLQNLPAVFRGRVTTPHADFEDNSPLVVYESLKNYQLSGSSSQGARRMWLLPGGVSLALTLLGSLSLLSILMARIIYPDLRGEPTALLEAFVLVVFLVPTAVGTVLAAWSVLRDLDFLQIFTFFAIPVAAIAGWSSGIASIGLYRLSPLELMLSTGFCVTGTLTIHSIMAMVFQWRLYWPVHAIGTWLAYTASSDYRLDAVARLTAWLLLMAPRTEAGQFGWRNRENYDTLINVCRVEREGSDWRGLIVPILAVLLIVIYPLLYEIPAIIEDSFWSTLALYGGLNPLPFVCVYLLLVVALGYTLELFLAKPANVLVEMAALQAKHTLNENPHPKEYRNFRAINLPHLAAVDLTRVSWRIIDQFRRQDGSYRCLIEKDPD